MAKLNNKQTAMFLATAFDGDYEVERPAWAVNAGADALVRMDFLESVLLAIRERSDLTGQDAQEMQKAAAYAMSPDIWPRPEWMKKNV